MLDQWSSATAVLHPTWVSIIRTTHARILTPAAILARLHIESRSAPRWHAVQGLTASTANTASDRHQPPARSTQHTRNATQHNTQWVASDWGDSRSLLIVAGRDDALPHVEVCDVSIIMFTHALINKGSDGAGPEWPATLVFNPCSLVRHKTVVSGVSSWFVASPAQQQHVTLSALGQLMLPRRISGHAVGLNAALHRKGREGACVMHGCCGLVMAPTELERTQDMHTATCA